jgi:hypothetical protein
VSEHRFTVIVNVANWDDPIRSVAAYAELALRCASLPDACQLDGFADLAAEADILTVDAG